MKKVAKGRLRVMKASRQGPKLSHLFFAYDLLLFAEPSLDQLECIKEGLDLFCKCSGQNINFHKSSYYSLLMSLLKMRPVLVQVWVSP